MKNAFKVLVGAMLLSGCATNGQISSSVTGTTAVVSTSFSLPCKSAVNNVNVVIKGVTDPSFEKYIVVRNIFSKLEFEESRTHVYPLTLPEGTYRVDKLIKPNTWFAFINDKYPIKNPFEFSVNGANPQYIGALNFESSDAKCDIEALTMTVTDMKNRDFGKAKEMAPELFIK